MKVIEGCTGAAKRVGHVAVHASSFSADSSDSADSVAAPDSLQDVMQDVHTGPIVAGAATSGLLPGSRMNTNPTSPGPVGPVSTTKQAVAASSEAEDCGMPAAADASPDDELLDGCFARAVLWMLQLLARWPRPPPDAGGGGLHADLKDLHGRLVNRRISAAFAEEPSLSARLCSGEVYALACALVFNVPLAELQRPSALETQTRVLEFLAQQGYHVLDADGDAAQAAQQLATGSGTGSDERWVHMSVLWRMMEAHTHSILDLTAVWTHAAALLAVPNPDELGDDGFSEAGEALQSWMEAVCTKFDRALATVQQRHGKTPSEIQRAMPAVTDLVGGFCDGVCVPGLWSFYLPKQVPTMRFQFFRKSRASLGLF